MALRHSWVGPCCLVCVTHWHCWVQRFWLYASVWMVATANTVTSFAGVIYFVTLLARSFRTCTKRCLLHKVASAATVAYLLAQAVMDVLMSTWTLCFPVIAAINIVLTNESIGAMLCRLKANCGQFLKQFCPSRSLVHLLSKCLANNVSSDLVENSVFHCVVHHSIDSAMISRGSSSWGLFNNLFKEFCESSDTFATWKMTTLENTPSGRLQWSQWPLLESVSICCSLALWKSCFASLRSWAFRTVSQVFLALASILSLVGTSRCGAPSCMVPDYKMGFMSECINKSCTWECVDHRKYFIDIKYD